MSKKLIGRFDKIDFPEFNLYEIEAKVDTGAYTSSIHSHKIEEFIEDGENFIKFTLLDPTHVHYNEKVYQTKNYRKKIVKSSNGLSEERFAIETTVVLFNESYPIELTLSERSDMRYPILLGRKFLNKKFIVDPSIKNTSFKLKQRA